MIITKAIGQSGTLNTVVRWGLLLLCLVVLGLALDLMLLRRYSASSTIFSRLRNYLRVNRLAATMTLVVPLVTALLSIAGPIESGGVNARISPSQGKAVTAQTQTQPPPSHPAKHS